MTFIFPGVRLLGSKVRFLGLSYYDPKTDHPGPLQTNPCEYEGHTGTFLDPQNAICTRTLSKYGLDLNLCKSYPQFWKSIIKLWGLHDTPGREFVRIGVQVESQTWRSFTDPERVRDGFRPKSHMCLI